MTIKLSDYAKNLLLSVDVAPESESPLAEGLLRFDEVRVTFTPLNNITVHESQVRARVSFVWKGKMMGYMESLPMEKNDMLTLHGVAGSLILKVEP